MYRRGIELFCKWYGKDVETILKERKDDLTPRPHESLLNLNKEQVDTRNFLKNFMGGCWRKALFAWLYVRINHLNSF